MLGGGRGKHVEPLRIRDDLACDQRAFEIGDHLVLGALIDVAGGGAVDLLGPLAQFLAGGERARRNGGLHGRGWDAHRLRLDHGPAAGALLAGLVLDHVDHRPARIGIVELEQLGRDLDEVGLQVALVPAGEDRADLLRLHAQPVGHQAVAFRDHLHVGVFDAVVDRLDEVTRPVRPQPVGAGVALEVGRDGLQDLVHLIVKLARAADHHGWAVARPDLAAGNADTEEAEALLLHHPRSADRVAIVRVAAVDDEIALVQQRQQVIEDEVHHLAGGHHQEDGTRPREPGDECLQVPIEVDVLDQVAGRLAEAFLHLVGTVVGGKTEAVVGDVEREVRAHHAQSEDTEGGFGHVQIRRHGRSMTG